MKKGAEHLDNKPPVIQILDPFKILGCISPDRDWKEKDCFQLLWRWTRMSQPVLVFSAYANWKPALLPQSGSQQD